MSHPERALQNLLNDPDVQLARTNNGVVRLPHHSIRLPAIFGFCGGVLRALQQIALLLETVEPENILLLGEIIHNPTVNNHLRTIGVTIVPETEQARAIAGRRPGQVLVIPAFGVTAEREKNIRSTWPDDAVIDTACGYVRRIWNFVENAARHGATVVVHGHPQHPETQATVSRAVTPHNTVVTLPDLDTAEQFANSLETQQLAGFPPHLVVNPHAADLRHIAVANQTTMLYSDTIAIVECLRSAAPDPAGVNAPGTVCRATQDRQDAAHDLCEKPLELAFVIGGFTSSNTAQLYRIARASTTAFFIENTAALTPDTITHFIPGQGIATTPAWQPPPNTTIGLLAGASCPPSDIGNVIRKLKQLLTQ